MLTLTNVSKTFNPGTVNEKKALSGLSLHLDEGEFLNVEKHSLQALEQMIMNNEIEDAKTIIAVLKAEKVLKDRAKE